MGYFISDTERFLQIMVQKALWRMCWLQKTVYTVNECYVLQVYIRHVRKKWNAEKETANKRFAMMICHTTNYELTYYFYLFIYKHLGTEIKKKSIPRSGDIRGDITYNSRSLVSPLNAPWLMVCILLEDNDLKWNDIWEQLYFKFEKKARKVSKNKTEKKGK
jgi:hypothetical protein